MIKIGICDDDKEMLERMMELLAQYRSERKYEIEYTIYRSSLDLLADMDRGIRWDILLLDIVMPGQNGMELAKELRISDNNVKIIFLTVSPEYAVESYTVGAYYYLLKPVSAERLFPILDRAAEECKKTQMEKLILKCKTGIMAIAPEQLEYCEVIGHRLIFHMDGGEVLESKGTLDELKETLSLEKGFLRVHRSYLVNLAYVQNISYKAVTLTSQDEVPIPHGKCNEIKKIYLSYIFEKERVLL